MHQHTPHYTNGIALLLLLVVTWVALSPRFSESLYYQRLFRPGDHLEPIELLRNFDGFENHETFFPTKDGTQLHGWSFINHTRRGLIILYHPGNAGNIASRLPVIELLLKCGASVFTYEPRGFGLSPGKPSISSILEDGEAAYDHLLLQGFERKQIVLLGESLGASVATHISQQHTTAGIILKSGFASLERITKEKLPLLRVYPSWLFPPLNLDNAAILAKPHPPLMLLHGEKDTLIDITHAEEIYERASPPKEIVKLPSSGHTLIAPQECALFVYKVSQFLVALPP